MVVRRVFTVGEVTAYLRGLLEEDPLLSNIWVRGEISNYRPHTSGHLYFTLKDETSSIRCVMFRSRAAQLSFAPANGMRVLVRGTIAIFERDGVYQLYAEELTPDGVGALYLAYLQLKERLRAEGLFEARHKKPLPLLPRKVGVVTSPNGAAWRDLVTIMRRRFPGIPIVLAPCAVQGEQAPAQIARALAALNARRDVDVIIVGRGGGSLEELWAFNTEEVARAIFASRIPVVSAVGHETDFSIADLVADLRAPTPSAAAELVVPCRADLEAKLASLGARLFRAASRYCEVRRTRLKAAAARDLARLYRATSTRLRGDLGIAWYRLWQGVRGYREERKARLAFWAGKLDALSPLAILGRGYSLCFRACTGELVRESSQVARGEEVEVVLGRGSLGCQVVEVREGEKWQSRERIP